MTQRNSHDQNRIAERSLGLPILCAPSSVKLSLVLVLVLLITSGGAG